jgi:ATP-dependent Lhr-like helicase
VGLSATVGNPKALLKWLVGSSPKDYVVVQTPVAIGAQTEVTLDFVGSLENAAAVISRLHRGEKRLVFCDSRSRVESLAGLLRSSGIQAFVSHSSLSAPERRRAEEAFARGGDCVIVATSTLELGIDVGDLDRVIQIDAPARVASFLQRLGRTGRRPGLSRNCLFLCTNEHALLRGAALLSLWLRGYVEPIVPPSLPYHIIAQQALALCLEHGGFGRRDLPGALKRLPAGASMHEEVFTSILDYMCSNRLLAADDVRFFVGEEGENVFGRRNFLELVSVFTSAPVLTVTDGRQDLGIVDQSLFFSREPAEGRLLSLAGRGWRVEKVDWRERRVFVSATELLGKTVWFGSSSGLSLAMCREIRTVLLGEAVAPEWSQRADTQIRELRARFSFLKEGHSTILQSGDGRIGYFTFGGELINLALAEALNKYGVDHDSSDDYALYFGRSHSREAVENVLRLLNAAGVIQCLGSNEEAERALKFSECLPADLRTAEVVARRCAESDLAEVLAEPRHFVMVENTDVLR